MQAILITAYKDHGQLLELAEKLHGKYAVFIHIDKKNADRFNMDELTSLGNVKVYSRYSITWGSIEHLYALIYLMKKALQRSDINYFHLISAQDIPVRSLDDFENETRIFMGHAEVPEERWKQYNLFQKFDQGKKSTERLYRGSVKLQKFLHIERRHLGKFRSIYKGMVWCSFPRAAAEYADEYIRVYPGFLKSLYTCYLPEELFFQTLFMNSPEWKDRIVYDNVRYMDWTFRNGSVPAVLDETDYDKIMASGKYFARKIDLAVSEKLMNRLAREVQ